jgi:hypothetical protein
LEQILSEKRSHPDSTNCRIRTITAGKPRLKSLERPFYYQMIPLKVRLHPGGAKELKVKAWKMQGVSMPLI